MKFMNRQGGHRLLVHHEALASQELLEMLKEYDPKLHAELGKTIQVLPGTGAPAAV